MSGCQRPWSTPRSSRSALYIRGAGEGLAALGVTDLTQSNGGVIQLDTAARLPARTVLSGPSTGVLSAQVTARLAVLRDLITLVATAE
jgi:N-methylhydantoinase A